MTTFVVTVPGTFVSAVTDSARSALVRKLASRHTDVSEGEGLDLLTLNEAAPSPFASRSMPPTGTRRNSTPRGFSRPR